MSENGSGVGIAVNAERKGLGAPDNQAKVVFTTVVIAAVLGIVAGVILYLSYSDTQRQQKNNLLNLATAFAAQTSTVAQAIDFVLFQANVMYLARPDHAAPFVFPMHERGARNHVLQGVVLYDLRGRVIGTSAPLDAATPPPAGAAPSSGAAPAIGIGNVDPQTGWGVILFQRDLHDERGAIIGSIVAHIDSARLAQLYALIRLGPGGSVTLLHRGGQMLIRSPGFPALIGRSMIDTPLFQTQLPRAQRGAFDSVSPLDGQARLYGYQAVDGFPLVIITGMNRSVALAAWYERLWLSLIVYVFVTLGLAGFGWRMYRDGQAQSGLIARLAYLADYDALTGLPNQPYFWRLFEQAIARAGDEGSAVAVIVLQLERLHEIIDLLGHGAGDRALTTIGATLASHLHDGVTVARVRGSEFAFLVPLRDGGPDPGACAAALCRVLSLPLALEGRDFYVAPFFGIALFPQDGRGADELYRCAQGASRPDDGGSGDAVRFYSAHAHVDMNYRLALEAELRLALARGEMRLVFQPKVTVTGARIVGVEALLRWSNGVLGDVSPADFIPVAEHTGLIVEIGAWVLEEACRALAQLQAGPWGALTMAVNLSPRQLHQKDLLGVIAGCMERYGIGPDMLELEITETALMSREQEVDVLLRRIRDLGVTLSIDDFGTGYSSLAYLKRFPVQRLKVDRAFVRDLGQDDDSAVIALTIMNLARGLRLKVVAEGVENAEQLAILRGMQCDEYQGFYFSRPIERGALDALLELSR